MKYALLKTARLPMIVGALVFLVPQMSDARPGAGGNSGSRGSKTFSAPPTTTTAPRPAAPIERSATPPGPGTTANNPGVQASPAQSQAKPGFLSGAFSKGLLAGLLGAGVMGLLFGHGLFGGMGDIMSILGLALQIGLIFVVVRLVQSLLRRRSPALAGATATGSPARGALVRDILSGTSAQTMGSQTQPLQYRPNTPRTQPLTLTPPDFNRFEESLVNVMLAYGQEDGALLSQLVTPEMLSYFDQELAENALKGHVNRLYNVKLLKGDLAEAWHEANAEYATVAMNYSLFDAMIVKLSGKVVEGSTTQAQAVTEIWTFMRPVGGNPDQWKLSAIQQA